ncbi:glycosyltransferase family 4 protein [Nocardioides sp. zg-DK7169]|uniref:glycosyltransferase family 4 protein n=1 Tax=Nocardioides sp. zg-DK7169 TaxID=2736600 RepID=UPI0034644EA3
MTWDSWVQRSKSKELAKKIFFRLSSSTLTPGPDSDAWARSYGARNLFRLHHAVDVEALSAAGSHRVDSPELRLLYVGRLVEDKGVPFILSVVEDLLERGLPITLRIVGSGALEAEVQSLVARWPDAVVFDGFVQSASMPSRYGDSDVLLFPTLGDPYGLVVDEALAAGLPVISSDRAGDISWRLADGRGWVLDPEAAGDWAATIERLARDRELLSRSRAAAVLFSRGHDVQRWATEIKRWVSSTA